MRKIVFAVALLLLTAFMPSADVARRQAEMVSPTARIEMGRAHGSATVVAQTSKGALLVTNAHVIKGDKEATDPSLTLWVYGKNGLPQEIEVAAEVVAIDEKRDLAVVRALSPLAVRPVTMAEPDMPVYTSETVWAVGCGLGAQAAATQGLFSSIARFQGQQVYITSAPAVPGNSGGGVYKQVGGRFVYVATVVAIAGIKDQLIPTTSMAIPNATLRAFLKDNGMDGLVFKKGA